MSQHLPEIITMSAVSVRAVTPSDSTTIPLTRALYVGGAGNVAVICRDDQNAVTFTAVPAGTTLSLQVWRVMSTGTTATNIVALR